MGENVARIEGPSVSEAISADGKNQHEENVALARDIFLEHGDFIRKVIRFRISDPDHADDLFQEFFLSIAGNPPRDVRELQAFLYRAIVNRCIDAGRRKQTYKAKLQQYADRRRYPSGQTPPDHRIIVAEEAEKMFGLIDERLPDYIGKTMTLRFKKGYKNDQIAKEIGVSNASVRRYVSDGLNRIRRLLHIGRKREGASNETI